MKRLIRLCPKCKCAPEVRRVGDWKQYYAVICTECGYHAADYCEAQVTWWDAIKLWNQRVGDQDD